MSTCYVKECKIEFRLKSEKVADLQLYYLPRTTSFKFCLNGLVLVIAIDKGPFNTSKICMNLRHCRLYENGIEEEQHFLLNCLHLQSTICKNFFFTKYLILFLSSKNQS